MSGLCFLSKLVEQVVAKQLMSHINNNKLDNPHQSTYKRGHSTETALLSIKHKVHLSLACGEPTALVLLDLSAAFDNIDHNILLGYLKSWFGLGGTVLKWLYLNNCCQAIKAGSTLSELSNLIYGIAQGSVLQMPWLVVVWTIVTLCLEACHLSISTNCKVFRIPLLVLLQIIESMLMLHPF